MLLQPSLFSTTTPACTLLSIALFTEWRSPAAKIVTPETRASPIISAAAVEAVREVLRVAFSRASCPVTPRRLSIGRPTSDAIGRTSRDENIAVPMNTKITPNRSGSQTALPVLPPNRGGALAPAPGPRVTPADGCLQAREARGREHRA